LPLGDITRSYPFSGSWVAVAEWEEFEAGHGPEKNVKQPSGRRDQADPRVFHYSPRVCLRNRAKMYANPIPTAPGIKNSQNQSNMTLEPKPMLGGYQLGTTSRTPTIRILKEFENRKVF
jgi:hypothetical protein